jgi:hypothetical protein
VQSDGAQFVDVLIRLPIVPPLETTPRRSFSDHDGDRKLHFNA